jgi:YgiT-type zinc finger domain-containing protein
MDGSIPMETDVDQRDEHMETSLTPGQPCRQCPEGTYEKGVVTETLERGDTVVVVKDVPALVCDVCGNSLLAAEEVKRLQHILEQAVAQGIELQSRYYQPVREGKEQKAASASESE